MAHHGHQARHYETKEQFMNGIGRILKILSAKHKDFDLYLSFPIKEFYNQFKSALFENQEPGYILLDRQFGQFSGCV